MSTVVRFSPGLGSWLMEHLDRGRPPNELYETMLAERMEPRVAQAILDAFLTARRGARPVPVDSLLLDDALLAPKPRIFPGARLLTADRAIEVHARAEQPTFVLLGNVMSPEEAAHLIALARPRLEPSTVVDPASGQDQIEAQRTSYGMFFRLCENAFIARLDRRISQLMNLPLENGEGLQVLHYPTGALNAPHFDFLQPVNDANRASIARSGQRVSTLLVYLNDVAAGGETIFPNLGWTVAPKLGNATYFEYTNAQGALDERSLHGSNPILAGEKWVLTKWMRERRFVAAGDRPAEGMLRN